MKSLCSKTSNLKLERLMVSGIMTNQNLRVFLLSLIMMITSRRYGRNNIL